VFAVIGTVPCGAEKAAARIRGFFSPSHGVSAKTVKMFGVKVLECTVRLPCRMSEKKILRRVETALKIIAGSGVRTVVCDSGFGYADLLGKHMLEPPDRLGMLRKMAAKIAAGVLGPRSSGKTAALYSKRLTPEFDEAVRVLLPMTRNLAVDCGKHRDGYARGLLAEYGISVLTNPAAFNSADIHIFFDAPGFPVRPKPDSTALCFCADHINPGCVAVYDAEFQWPERLGDPGGYPPQALISALFSTGVLSASELKVKRLIRRDAVTGPVLLEANGIAIDKDSDSIYNTL